MFEFELSKTVKLFFQVWNICVCTELKFKIFSSTETILYWLFGGIYIILKLFVDKCYFCKFYLFVVYWSLGVWKLETPKSNSIHLYIVAKQGSCYFQEILSCTVVRQPPCILVTESVNINVKVRLLSLQQTKPL